jgi:hypothetical protein
MFMGKEASPVASPVKSITKSAKAKKANKRAVRARLEIIRAPVRIREE